MYGGMIDPGGLQGQMNPNGNQKLTLHTMIYKVSFIDSQFMQQAPIPTSKISNDLITRALNYHGQQLTSFFKETPVFHDLDLKNVDYHLYHQRSKELRMEDRGKRLLLHRYMGLILINTLSF